MAQKNRRFHVPSLKLGDRFSPEQRQALVNFTVQARLNRYERAAGHVNGRTIRPLAA